jgi:hypothetical protein
MSDAPLMPKATAVWLIDNTRLTFRQIADFCVLHELEVKGIADGDVAQGIKGQDPIASSQLSREELERGENDENHRLQISEPKTGIPVAKGRKGPRYTPVSRRQDRPDAIYWLLRHHPELTDSQLMKLVGTTKTTIQAIRERTHWNSPNIKAVDPVTLGLCTQLELDFAVDKAARRRGKPTEEPRPTQTLLPASETTAEPPVFAEASATEPAPEREADKVYDADSVFAKLKGLKTEEPAESEK